MWKFIIKQDKLVVAKGFSEYKSEVVCEALHYATMYCTEDYSKMTIEIVEDKKHE